MEPLLEERHPWVAAMRNCPQNPLYHREGDVWTHTRMVCQCLEEDPEFGQLPEAERLVLRWAALLHDVAKPACTREDFSAPGHARKGARMARRLLWERGFPPRLREQVCGLVRHHMVPYRLIDRDDWQRQLFLLMLHTRPDHLRLLSRADIRGRICDDTQALLDRVELFWQLAQENPLPFVDDHSRLGYFLRGGDPGRKVYPEVRCQVVVMSGLPASGKDTWIQKHLPDWPQISLDQWRAQLKVSPRDPQHEVVEKAREQARAWLRKGQSFVWNATHLSPEMRQRTLSLLYDYQAQVRLIYCETDLAELERRNSSRPAPVPQAALTRMLERWEIPGLEEAHQVEYPW